jgi:hypothetical protein
MRADTESGEPGERLHLMVDGLATRLVGQRDPRTIKRDRRVAEESGQQLSFRGRQAFADFLQPGVETEPVSFQNQLGATSLTDAGASIWIFDGLTNQTRPRRSGARERPLRKQASRVGWSPSQHCF